MSLSWEKGRLDVDEIACRLVTKLRSTHGMELLNAGLKLVAVLTKRMEPISLEEVGGICGVRTDQVLSWWKTRDFKLELNDNQDMVVGAGISILPKIHSYEDESSGKVLFGWCAMDVIMCPLVLDQKAIIRSTCPVTGEEISMRINADGIHDVRPGTALVSFGIPGGADIRQVFCNRTNFYSTPEAALCIFENDKEVAITTPEKAFEVLKNIASLLTS